MRLAKRWSGKRARTSQSLDLGAAGRAYAEPLRGGVVGEPGSGGQRLVRRRALSAAQQQGEGRDHHRHAAAARGRSRRLVSSGRAAFERLSLPAIAEKDEVHVVETPFGRQEFRRAAGASILHRRGNRR